MHTPLPFESAWTLQMHSPWAVTPLQFACASSKTVKHIFLSNESSTQLPKDVAATSAQLNQANLELSFFKKWNSKFHGPRGAASYPEVNGSSGVQKKNRAQGPASRKRSSKPVRDPHSKGGHASSYRGCVQQATQQSSMGKRGRRRGHTRV
ncbi:hypothetical protein LR48_Vigan11g044700 [Vigna angularis]|uniref:Uncharacterized protein n=1 Tax=Phaseolus angularis TaxID=3914 RepID=A0A0L9VRN4_PHAAN|nr:hypothetical protein LR48_Vigan11g044700 [Vigna angularis]